MTVIRVPANDGKLFLFLETSNKTEKQHLKNKTMTHKIFLKWPPGIHLCLLQQQNLNDMKKKKKHSQFLLLSVQNHRKNDMIN